MNAYSLLNNSESPLIAIIGASGFVGRNLIAELLDKTSFRIRAVARHVEKIEQTHERLELVSGNVSSRESMKQCLKGATTVFFLVHKLESRANELFETEAKVASEFAKVAKEEGIKRVVYLSGLGNDDDRLSQHLASRHHTGDIFRAHIPEVVEFRAGLIVGQDSISFEIVRYLIQKIPVLMLPPQVKTVMQPIRIEDVIEYLVSSINLQLEHSEIIEIGGPEKMNYQEFLKRYAKFAGKRRLIFCLPFMPLWLAGWFLYLVTPSELGRVGRNMVQSFQNEMIVTNQKAKTLFPNITPKPVEESFF